MARLLRVVSRGGLALTGFLMALAVLRFAPVAAEVPFDVRALPLALPLLACAVVAALTGRGRRPRAVRPLLAGLVVTAVALAGVVALRGPGGLPADVSGPRGPIGLLPAGPIDLTGDDVEGLSLTRRVVVRWRGALRAPATGTYGLLAEGRGEIEVRLDGRPVLHGAGERLEARSFVPLGRGEHQLDVRYERVGPGLRLRLGWTPPRSDGSPGTRSEPLPPRWLGPAGSAALWRLTDLLALLVASLAAALLLAVPWDAPSPLPAPVPVGAREVALSLLGHVVLLSVMTWPLVTDLAGHGVLHQPDGRLNAWILAWGAHALANDPLSVFTAPIFHPLPDAFAFSENLLLVSLLALPAILMGGPVLGYNLALLAGDAVSGLGVQLLVRRATRDSFAGFVGGALFAAGIHRFINMAHLHAQFTPFLPFALLALDRFLERRTLARALLVGLLVAAQGAASVYLGAITATAVAVGLALAAISGLRPAEAARALLGLLLAAALLAPLARPYLRMRAFEGEEFTLATVASFATTPESYAASAAPFYAGLTRRHLDPERVHDPLFPGLVALLAGVAGLARAPRRFAALALVASGVAALISLGPETAFYRFLHEHVVLVRGLRALARFSLIPLLALATLAGVALAGRRRLAIAGLLLALIEAWNGPFGYTRYAGPSPLARSLAGQAGALLVLPLGQDDTAAMLDGIAHFRPLVNGDSGIVPRAYSRAMELLDAPASEEALRFLRAADVRQIVARSPLPLPREAEHEGAVVYTVPAGERARAVVPARPRATLFTPEGPIVDLGAEETLRRVTFALSEAPWVGRPRLLASSDGLAWHAVEGRADLGDATLSLYRDPRGAHGEVLLEPVRARYLRLDPRLPARPGSIGAEP